MKFGKVDHPELIDFVLPPDHPDTLKVLSGNVRTKNVNVYVGCAKWNKQDLANFYPRGTRDELTYYATQFNCIELNATFYNNYGAEQIRKWKDKTPDDFRFFPKVPQVISHLRRLSNVEGMTEEFCDNVAAFESRLGMAFLQLHDNFGPRNFDRLTAFVSSFPQGIPLALELRNTEWFNNEQVSGALYDLLEKYQITNIITATAGRRDLLHMRLTTPSAFIRWVGANHESDYRRLDDWLERLKTWVDQGLQNLFFFVHQNHEKESPLLSAYFIKKLNATFGWQLKVPLTPGGESLELKF